jgi:hypothetical protein
MHLFKNHLSCTRLQYESTTIDVISLKSLTELVISTTMKDNEYCLLLQVALYILYMELADCGMFQYIAVV